MKVTQERGKGSTGFWDEEHAKALLHFPRYPVRLLQEDPWQAWITQRGGFKAVYSYLQNYLFSPSHRRILDVVLSSPDEISDVYAERLNISRATYFYRLRELLPAVVNALNHWELSERSEQPHGSAQSTIPTPLTSLVGVESILQTLLSLLVRDDVRLLTLLGPGGVGKTRLSIEVANRVSEHFQDGVYFVDLSALRAPEAILPAVAAAVGLEEEPDAQIRAFWTQRQSLLVLDNFEHLLSGVALITELLAAAPRLKILVTSRAALHIYGEHQFTIPPLPTETLTEYSDIREIAASPAITLFTQRAQAVNPDFNLTHANVQAVVELCLRMDGIPLAIELAAYQVKFYSPQAILVRLSISKGLDFLNNGPKRPHPHQQTPRAILDWSYQLLTPELQALFSRLSVFVDGCTSDAATMVCSERFIMEIDSITVEDTPPTGAQDDTLPVRVGLAALAEQSLLQKSVEPDGEPRYQMLGITREYGSEQLECRGETYSRERAHALYYLNLAEQAQSSMSWVDALKQEYANLSAAIQWFLHNHEGEMGLRLVAAMWKFWRYSGNHREGYQVALAALEQTKHVLHPVRMEMLRLVGWLAHDLRDVVTMAWAFQSILELAGEMNDARGVAIARQGLAEIAQSRGHWQEANEHIRYATSLLEDQGDQRQLAWAVMLAGRTAFSQGDLQESLARLQESKRILDVPGAASAKALVLCYLGRTMFYQGRIDEAALQFEESLGLSKTAGDRYSLSLALAHNYLAEVAIRQHQLERAQEKVEVCRALSKSAGYTGCLDLANTTSALLALGENRLSDAEECFRESLRLQDTVGECWRSVELLDTVSMYLVRSNESLSAARLFGAVQRLRDTLNIRRFAINQPEYDRSLLLLRERLDAVMLDDAWMAGQTLPLEQANAYALRCLE